MLKADKLPRMATTPLKRYFQTGAMTQEEFAEKLGVSPSMVSHWVNGRVSVAAERAPTIERVTRGRVRCEAICPGPEWAVLRRRRKA